MNGNVGMAIPPPTDQRTLLERMNDQQKQIQKLENRLEEQQTRLSEMETALRRQIGIHLSIFDAKDAKPEREYYDGDYAAKQSR